MLSTMNLRNLNENTHIHVQYIHTRDVTQAVYPTETGITDQIELKKMSIGTDSKNSNQADWDQI
jgi:hypothetical protein